MRECNVAILFIWETQRLPHTGNHFGWFPTPYVQEMEQRCANPNASAGTITTTKEADVRQAADPSTQPAEDYRMHVVQDILSSEYAFLTGIEQFLKSIASPVRALPHIPSKAKRALLGQLFRVVHVCSQQAAFSTRMFCRLTLFFVCCLNILSTVRRGGGWASDI